MEIKIKLTKKQMDTFKRRAEMIKSTPDNIVTEMCKPFFEGNDEDFQMFLNLKAKISDPNFSKEILDEFQDLEVEDPFGAEFEDDDEFGDGLGGDDDDFYGSGSRRRRY
jgi:hypothetical protein